ncbi:Thioredoxin reductase 3 [Manis javanica]|nr:Thioredoxin reductase 3 [Manis javanica]
MGSVRRNSSVHRRICSNLNKCTQVRCFTAPSFSQAPAEPRSAGSCGSCSRRSGPVRTDRAAAGCGRRPGPDRWGNQSIEVNQLVQSHADDCFVCEIVEDTHSFAEDNSTTNPDGDVKKSRICPPGNTVNLDVTFQNFKGINKAR